MAGLGFRGVSKVFLGGAVAVDRLDLEIEHGEFVVFVGPSGSGKTTVLRLTAGLEELTEGEIVIGDRVVNDVHPMDRDIAMVFQNYALYPHMTVAENMGFGLKLHKVRKPEIKKRVHETAHVLGISQLLGEAGPALGRAAAASRDGPGDRARAGRLPDGRAPLEPRRQAPRPDAHRDPCAPASARDDHDLRHPRPDRGDDDGDRVAVMRNGRLAQVDAPQVLYDRPLDLFVAGFIGSPAMNFLAHGSVRRRLGRSRDRRHLALLPERALPLDRRASRPRRDRRHPAGERRGRRALRADGRQAGSRSSRHARRADGSGSGRAFPARRPAARHPRTPPFSPAISGQEPSNGSAAPGQVTTTTFTARLDPRSGAVRGLPMKLVIEPSAIYFFDPKTESALR